MVWLRLRYVGEPLLLYCARLCPKPGEKRVLNIFHRAGGPTKACLYYSIQGVNVNKYTALSSFNLFTSCPHFAQPTTILEGGMPSNLLSSTSVSAACRIQVATFLSIFSSSRLDFSPTGVGRSSSRRRSYVYIFCTDYCHQKSSDPRFQVTDHTGVFF